VRTRVEFDREKPVLVWEGDLPVVQEGLLLRAPALGVAAARVIYAYVTLMEGGIARQTVVAH